MNNYEYLQTYFVPIVEFLSEVMGNQTEIVLHDASNLSQSIIAIKNGHVTGRKVGDPTTNLVLKTLKAGADNKTDYVSNYHSKNKNNKDIISSSYFIRRDRNIIGILCINRDVTDFYDLQKLVNSISSNCPLDADKSTNQDISENLTSSTSEIVENELSDLFDYKNKLSLSQQEKINVITHLHERGIFLLKGAVKEVADIMGISEQSVYRYIKMIPSSD